MAEVAENTVVDGRYRVIGQIGSGGMADVFSANDTTLGRRVAVKILHARFAEDRNFVERFRREASSAAGLSHPNVVSVYDRGSHEDTYYIAMEYLEGRTLKDLLVAEAPLDQERTIDLGVQLVEAAGFAHRHGVIHRDLKPQNVIVDDEGHLKVTDFGIARAGASEMTETGSIMGTAHYLSPEQAQGKSVDATSDLYSIGVILFEMLAGQLPFHGDSAVSIAVQHLNQAPPPLSTVRPDVHPVLEAVVMRALAKDPVERFRDAGELVAALEHARHAVRSGEDGVLLAPPGLAPEPLPDDEARGQRWLVWTVAVLGLLLAGLLLILILRTGTVQVPNVTGKPVAEAAAVLEREGLEPRPVRVTSGAPEGVVVGQEPPPGRTIEGGAAVLLRVSGGPGVGEVPAVRNLAKRRAIQKLNEAGFNVEEEERSPTTIDEGLAIRTVPREGEDLERGSRVRLIVSTGPEQVEVPSLEGSSLDSAEGELEDAGLEARVERIPSDEPEDRVLGQDPGAGTTVDEGSEVAITVSDGPADDSPDDSSGDDTPASQATVPDVVGETEEDARTILTQAGLSVQIRGTSDTVTEPGLVDRQRPEPGRRLEIGRTVVIYVAEEP
ncbi:MAG: PASTA domain-containing protein [Thermoleophilaceae bacterium]